MLNWVGRVCATALRKATWQCPLVCRSWSFLITLNRCWGLPPRAAKPQEQSEQLMGPLGLVVLFDDSPYRVFHNPDDVVSLRAMQCLR